MKSKEIIIISFILIGLFNNTFGQNTKSAGPSDTLVVVWSSGDIEVAEKACLMYAHAAKRNKWFNEVILVVWGPSQKLFLDNKMVKEKVATMQKDGVIVQACVSCANMYGVANDLKVCGVDVIGMGVPLTKYLKRGYKVLTY